MSMIVLQIAVARIISITVLLLLLLAFFIVHAYDDMYSVAKVVSQFDRSMKLVPYLVSPTKLLYN